VGDLSFHINLPFVLQFLGILHEALRWYIRYLANHCEWTPSFNLAVCYLKICGINTLNWNFVRCFCGYEICSLAQREEYSLLTISENELLRRIFGSMMKEVRGWWEYLHARGFIIYILQNTIFMRWSRSMSWTGKVRNVH